MFLKSSRLDLKALDRKLWKLVSDYVRRRDCRRPISNGSGFCGDCITCGKIWYMEDMDAGHFISRNKKAVRFDFKNINAQCRGCNRFQSGRQFEHAKAIDRKWGAGTADALLIKSKQPCKRGRADYLVLIEEMKEKLKKFKA